MMDLTLPAGALDQDAKTALVDDLTTALLHAERAPDTEFFRSITWAFVHELETGDIYSSGKPIDRPLARLMVTTPEGALSDRRRGEMTSEATRLLRAALDIGDDDALRVWVTFREIADGSWGAAGEIVRFAQLREAAAAQRAEAPVT
jgi:phenylpyruvate tautomerase PptA (4-oxalocrotonate tautomerase family)